MGQISTKCPALSPPRIDRRLSCRAAGRPSRSTGRILYLGLENALGRFVGLRNATQTNKNLICFSGKTLMAKLGFIRITVIQCPWFLLDAKSSRPAVFSQALLMLPHQVADFAAAGCKIVDGNTPAEGLKRLSPESTNNCQLGADRAGG